MAVVIENLHTEEAAAAPTPTAAPEAARENGIDERQLLDALALEAWAAQRLVAD